jgi:arsenate reductase
MMTLYGISNCDTVRKARRWLDDRDCKYRFHDFRADGLREETLRQWLQQQSWDALLNRRSTSWRQLDETQKRGLDDKRALQLMLKHPTLIKRPVLQQGKTLLVGFDPAAYQQLLK